MNKSGQMVSIDFLISIIAVTLAIGLLIQFTETKTYNEKEELEWLELKQVAETASELLVNNPNIVCELVDESGNHIQYLSNCIPKRNPNPDRITKEDMGIPAGYECWIDKDDLKLHTHNSQGCSRQPPGADIENVYSVTRKVIFYNKSNSQQVSKETLHICMGEITGDCAAEGLEEDEFTLKVWKA